MKNKEKCKCCCKEKRNQQIPHNTSLPPPYYPYSFPHPPFPYFPNYE